MCIRICTFPFNHHRHAMPVTHRLFKRIQHRLMAMTWFSDTNDDHCVPQWIRTTARIFGFWPHSIGASTKHHCLIRGYAWSALVVVMYLGGIYGQCSTVHILQRIEFSCVEVIINSITIACYGFTSIAGVAMAIAKRHTLAHFFNILREVDHEV